MVQNRNNSRKGQNENTRSAPSRSQSEAQALKGREYRDEKGQIHHHTKTYMEQHRGEERGRDR